MNAMQHYREAERLMKPEASMRFDGVGTFLSDHERFAAAQVHATLALVAVQAATGPWREETTEQWRNTFDAASTSERGTRND